MNLKLFVFATSNLEKRHFVLLARQNSENPYSRRYVPTKHHLFVPSLGRPIIPSPPAQEPAMETRTPPPPPTASSPSQIYQCKPSAPPYRDPPSQSTVPPLFRNLGVRSPCQIRSRTEEWTDRRGFLPAFLAIRFERVLAPNRRLSLLQESIPHHSTTHPPTSHLTTRPPLHLAPYQHTNPLALATPFAVYRGTPRLTHCGGNIAGDEEVVRCAADGGGNRRSMRIWMVQVPGGAL